MTSTTPLETELKTYDAHLAELLTSDAGRHVLIRGETIVGTYDTYGDTLQAGYEKFGLVPFLVKRIQASGHVQNFTRDIIPL